MKLSAKRPALLVASLLLMGSLAACGSDDGGDKASAKESASSSSSPSDDASASPSDDASAGESAPSEDSSVSPEAAEFCASFSSAQSVTSTEDMKEFGQKLQDQGAPDGLTDEQQNGFDTFVEVLADLDESIPMDKLEDPDLSKQEEADVDAFLAWTGENCVPSASPAP